MISFKVNPLFLVVIIIFSLAGMLVEALTAFILVFLHELVHFLVAWQTGHKIYKIELFPFGGMAEYKGLLEMDPWSELRIALAGPLFNLILAVLFFLMGRRFNLIPVDYCNLLIKYNLILGVFNLLPALPLDGGRVLRSILVSKTGFKKGTNISIKTAKIIAVTGGLAGITALLLNQSNLWILFISFFVYGAATREENKVIYSLLTYLTRRKEFIENIRIKPAIVRAVRGNIFLQEVVGSIIPGKFNLFCVLDKDLDLVGIITEIRLLDMFFNLDKKDKQIKDIID